MSSIFTGLITSKTRVNILMRLFLNPERKAYLRELSSEFRVSSSQVSEELKQLKESGFISSEKNGRQIEYCANRKHPLFSELHSMVQKALGMDRILDSIIERVGDLEEAYLVDDYAVGRDSGLIDLVLVGRISAENVYDLTGKTEKYIGRKIRTLILTRSEFQRLRPTLEKRHLLQIWRYDTGSIDHESDIS